jgi:hypothetical protein
MKSSRNIPVSIVVVIAIAQVMFGSMAGLSKVATFGKLGLSQIGYELFQVMQDFGILARQLNSL